MPGTNSFFLLSNFIDLVITCADPGEVVHATKIVKDPNYSYNSQVSYQCHTNYMSDSKPVMLCDRNGQWNRKKPICRCKYI